MIRFPYAPLERCITLRFRETVVSGQLLQPTTMFCKAFEIDRRVIARWRSNGLTLRSADRAACLLGLHPMVLWPDEYERTLPTNPAEHDAAGLGVAA